VKTASVLVLVLGLSAAVAIYVLAPEPDESMAIYEMTISKQYNRQLLRFGGKASVLFDEMQTWFAARWQGKALGVTVGWIAVAVALGLYLGGRKRD
jgi:hypothetical protein